MEIRKVKYDGAKLAIEWGEENLGGDTTISHSLRSEEKPSPAFVEAFQAVVEPAARLLELNDEQADRSSCRGVSISSTDGRMGVVVTLLREIDGASAPVVENTPHLMEEDIDDPNPSIPFDLQRAVDDLCAFAGRFVLGKEREQSDMFEDEVAGAMEDRNLVAT